ncbi:MAG: nucleotidyltransferase domain-containing protein [Bacteroidetes bacterium]|nr:nucleotidyltransferase domain-containing protein [Bacteroidota bacterium]
MIAAKPQPGLLNESTHLLNFNESVVVKTLLYFNIFYHPLTAEEIEKYCSTPLSFTQLKDLLDSLFKKGLIFKVGKAYSLKDDLTLIHKRNIDAERAERIMPKARLFSRIISWFPFVKGVFISGSLSKGVLKEDGDIDYFIVTSGNRLWICRSLLILFKKVFLFNSHKYFCLNYFVDENNLTIQEKNIFTAIEIESLIPLYNFNCFLSFKQENKWTKNFLPNTKEPVFFKDKQQSVVVKNFLELCFSNSLGLSLNNFFKRVTLKYWTKKFQSSAEINFKENIKVKDDVAKYHPNRFQEKVLQKLEEEIAIFELTTGYKLS